MISWSHRLQLVVFSVDEGADDVLPNLGCLPAFRFPE